MFAGRITDNQKTEVDLIVVGNKVSEKKLEILLKKLGLQTGYELAYVLLTPQDFTYRQEINDRLVTSLPELKSN